MLFSTHNVLTFLIYPLALKPYHAKYNKGETETANVAKTAETFFCNPYLLLEQIMKNKFSLIMSIAISVFSIQSQAADNLCDVNIQSIDDVIHTAGQNLGGGVVKNLEQVKQEAMEAKKAGDNDKCVALTQRAITNIGNSTMGGGRN